MWYYCRSLYIVVVYMHCVYKWNEVFKERGNKMWYYCRSLYIVVVYMDRVYKWNEVFKERGNNYKIWYLLS